MAGIAEYLLSVTGAAMISAVVLRLLEGRGSAASLAKMLTGIFMVLTVITPITRVRLSDALELLPDISLDAREAVAQGEASSKNALAQCISTQVEAYILDKAAALGVVLTVEVELTNDTVPVPKRVYLQGNVSPYAKTRLQSMLSEDLGIDKENQIWM